MFTRMLSVLGLHLGGPLQKPAADNRKGFWENRFFQSVNMRLLEAAGSDPDGFDRAEKLGEAAVAIGASDPEPLLPGIAEHIATFARPPAWGFKDPRTVVTYPFWLRCFARLGFDDVRPVVVVRSPESCLSSLRKRGDFRKRNLSPDEEFERVLGIWLAYHELMNAYLPEDALIVLQRDLLDERLAAKELLRCARALGLDARRIAPAVATIDTELLTSRPESEAPIGVPAVDDLYASFVARAEAQKRAFGGADHPIDVPMAGRRRSHSIYVVSPDGYEHSRAFDDHALNLHVALRRIGIVAPIVTHPWEIEGTPIVLGGNLAPRAGIQLPAGSILYNLEQVDPDSPWLNHAYIELLRQHRVWDYSPRNVAALASMGITNVRLCGVGSSPELFESPTIGDETKDIDVLFFGSVNERRQRVLEQLSAGGARVTTLFGIYGSTRDAFVRRAKIVLNVHHFEAKIFEVIRVSHLLAQGACVVSETGGDRTLEATFARAVAFADYDAIADRTLALLGADEERVRLAREGQKVLRSLDQARFVREALSEGEVRGIREAQAFVAPT